VGNTHFVENNFVENHFVENHFVKNHFVENPFVENHFVKIQKDGQKTSGGSLRRKRQSMAAWVRVLAI
jgi:hypothetical protein